MSEEYTKIKQQAMSLLARREHAVEELRQKLGRKHSDHELLEQVINGLIEDGYLNEARYVEMMIRSRYGRGHGPMRIKQELRQQRVPDLLIQEAFETFEGDWFESARYVREKKFGVWQESPNLGLDKEAHFKERARQMRFLASRGFSSDQIEEAFSAE